MAKPVRITSYRADMWLNTKTNEGLFGVSVKIEGIRGWVRVMNNGKAVIVDTRAQAEQYIVDMKAERDERGFKRAA